jgi:hypothetical protein
MRNGLAGEYTVYKERIAIAGCAIILLAAACADPPESQQTSPAPPDTTRVAALPTEWEIDTLDAPRFRAYGWGRDTLWGIGRGRLAFVADSSLTLLADTVWGVWTTPGHDMVAWTNEGGVFMRTSAGRRQLLGRTDTPPDADPGPDMAWGSETRGFLTWTSEAAPPISVIDGPPGSLRHRVLRARASPDQFATQPALWLDDARVLVAVVAHRAKSGPSMPSEGGRRANLGIIDIVKDSIAIVTDVADGTFLRPEGMLHADTVLVAVREGDVPPARHVAYDTRTWTQKARLNVAGRAAACGGHIAMLRPASDPAAGGEMSWDAEVHGPDGSVRPLGRYTGFDVRLLWDATCARLAIAQESERAGYVTVVVKQAR